MSTIDVTNLFDMPERVRRLRPARLVSIIQPELQPERPPELAAESHLRMRVHDISAPQPGGVLIQRADVESLVDFSDAWQPSTESLISRRRVDSRGLPIPGYRLWDAVRLCARAAQEESGMNLRRSCALWIAAFFFSLLTGTLATAQTWNSSQKEVWKTIVDSYEDIEKEDTGWSDKWVMPNASVWGDAPMPRTRDSVKRWDGFNFGRSDTLVSEYSPAAIVVHENMAVAHYYYSTGDKDEEGKTKITHGKCTDILVRSKDSWRFIAWNCADLPGNN